MPCPTAEVPRFRDDVAATSPLALMDAPSAAAHNGRLYVMYRRPADWPRPHSPKIADALHLSLARVKTPASRLLARLGHDNRTQASIRAYEADLIPITCSVAA